MPTAIWPRDSIRPTATGEATASRPSATAVVSDPDQRPTTNASTETSNISGWWLPERAATTTGTTTPSETTQRGTLRRYAHNTNAATGIAIRMRSTTDDGSDSAATTATTSAKIGTRRRTSSAWAHARPDSPATSGTYRVAAASTSPYGRNRAPDHRWRPYIPARAIAIPSRVGIRNKSTSNSANVARILKNILHIGSLGSEAVPPIESRTPPADSEAPIARASGTERASRSSLGPPACRPHAQRPPGMLC